MYLPALPMLQAQWGVELSTINLTLVLFFVFFSVSMLVYGPLSDSYGRRPLLLIGIGIYIVASILCSLAGNVQQLIVFRILQALGAASASSLCMAITKDLFEAQARQRLLAQLGVIVALAPMLSPIIGGAVLNWLSWHWIFMLQASWGAVAFWGVYRMPEPLPAPVPASLFEAAARYSRLFKNRRFMIMNFMVALSLCPIFAFIAASPTIYISHFGVSEQAFGFFFGANAVALMAGSFACSYLTRKISSWPLIQAGFTGILCGGIAACILGNSGPVVFAATMFAVTFCIGLIRPIGNNLVLEQVDQDIGAAASLLVFLYFVFGAISMGMASLNWSDHIRFLSFLSATIGSVLLITLQLIRRFWKISQKPVR